MAEGVSDATKERASAEERGRWSSKKMVAVLRLKVNAVALSSWREVFLAL
jgi:hypothetical protein